MSRIDPRVPPIAWSEPGTIPLIDDNRIKRYRYAKTAATTLDSAVRLMRYIIGELGMEYQVPQLSRRHVATF